LGRNALYEKHPNYTQPKVITGEWSDEYWGNWVPQLATPSTEDYLEEDWRGKFAVPGFPKETDAWVFRRHERIWAEMQAENGAMRARPDYVRPPPRRKKPPRDAQVASQQEEDEHAQNDDTPITNKRGGGPTGLVSSSPLLPDPETERDQLNYHSVASGGAVIRREKQQNDS
jgi:hypothetical protein